MYLSSTNNKVEEALFFIEDIFERAMVPFVVLGKTSRQVVDNKPLEGIIEIGVRKQDWTDGGRSTVKMLIPQVKTNERLQTFEHEGVWIKLRIIHKKYKVLNTPDNVFYGVTNFRIPNPFEDYWKFRRFVS